jgi:hypothetical protein
MEKLSSSRAIRRFHVSTGRPISGTERDKDTDQYKAPTTLPPNSTPQASSSLQGRGLAQEAGLVSPRFAIGAGVTICHVDHDHAQKVRGQLLHCEEKPPVVLEWSFG